MRDVARVKRHHCMGFVVLALLLLAPDAVLAQTKELPRCRGQVVQLPPTISSSTLVYADCLHVPRGTRIRVNPEAHLVVVAREWAVIEDDVEIDASGEKPTARGADGTQGFWGAKHDEYWRAMNSGGCQVGKTGPGEENYHIVGKRGPQGGHGGRIHLALRNARVGTNVRIKLDGGPGGDPGTSNRLTCYCNEHGNHLGNEDDGIRDSARPPTEGEGPTGTPGSVSIALIGAGAAAELRTLKSAVTPRESVSHAQSYLPRESRRFGRIEVRPIADEANRLGYVKVPPP